jgi:hypothetical protein
MSSSPTGGRLAGYIDGLDWAIDAPEWKRL